MKELISAFCILFFSINSFALFEFEKHEFREKIENLDDIEKMSLIGVNISSMMLECSAGTLMSGLVGAAESLPVVTAAVDATGYLFDNGYDISPFRRKIGDYERHSMRKETRDGSQWELFGGVLNLVAGTISQISDLSDGEIDNKEAYARLKDTYITTRFLADKAFSESGYCTDKFHQLGILLGL